MVLVFLADVQKWYDAFVMAGCAPREPGAGDLFLAVEDAWHRRAERRHGGLEPGRGFLLYRRCDGKLRARARAAGSAGIRLSRGNAGAGLSHPRHSLERRKPARCPLEEIVCENRYVRKDEQALRRLLSNHGAWREIEAWLRAFCARKYDCAFSREMTRSAQVYLARFPRRRKFSRLKIAERPLQTAVRLL